MMTPELSIDLDALASNYRSLQTLARGAAVAGVVKADAYGLGLEPVVRRLCAEGCRSFFVAQRREAERLRAIDAQAEVFVLNGYDDAAELRRLRDQRITPVINHAAALALHDGGPAALHLDSGMSRLGLDARETAALLANPPPAQTLLLMTHLASSDEADLTQNNAQVAQFAGWVAALRPGRASLNNSAGCLIDSNPRYDLIRPGIALYGAPPRPHPARFQPVIALDAPIIQLRDIAVGTPVGYGATWRAQRPSRIATLPLGYADGFLRSQSFSPGFVAIDGQRCPIIGRVSMDLTTIDVTDLPQPPRLGQRVEVIGPTITLEEVAARAGTIAYEILTGLGQRYHRRWQGER